MIQDKRPVGRPRALTPEKKHDVIVFLTAGGSRKMAAKYVGCHPTTIAQEAGRDSEFADQLEEAEAKCYLTALGKIHKSSDWKAAAWLLSRKWPEEYAEVKKIAETDAAGEPLTDTERRRAVNAILRERFGDRASFLTESDN